MPDYEIKTGDRAAVIAGLRDLADFLEANPHVLTPCHPAVGVCVDAADPAARREGARYAAGLLGLDAEDLGRGHFGAHRYFGPVAYFIAAVPPRERP